MKEDYLWDKTGADPDIEKLENALEVFRYKQTAPPELPAKVLPFRKEEPQLPRRIFSFAVAAAACLVFGIIAIGIWQVLKNNAEAPANLAESTEPEIAAPPVPFVSKEADPPKRSGKNFPEENESAKYQSGETGR
jgi:cytoskeletal protein RodZ